MTLDQIQDELKSLQARIIELEKTVHAITTILRDLANRAPHNHNERTPR